jgi:hypothetical protein
MSDPLIKTKIPQITDNMPVEDVVNFIAKTLNESKNTSSQSSSTNTFSFNSPVGTILTSMLTLTQFQSLAGTNWVLADGSSCTGTAYSSVTGFSNLPDCRGATFRGKSYLSGRNSDGDTALGTYQGDSARIATGTFADGGTYVTRLSAGITAYTANETVMKNITVNIFIKIN